MVSQHESLAGFSIETLGKTLAQPAAVHEDDGGSCATNFRQKAWTSSTITVSTERRVSRAWEPSRRNRDSGVVTRMSAGTGAHVDPNLPERPALRFGQACYAGQRPTHITFHVIYQRLERRYV